jgi:hypothetical protein
MKLSRVAIFSISNSQELGKQMDNNNFICIQNTRIMAMEFFSEIHVGKKNCESMCYGLNFSST